MSKATIRPGFHVKAKAQDVHDELERIRDGGELTAQAVVDESKPKTAPLHNEFEWRDKVAANAYRCEQARYVIRAVQIEVDEVGPVRKYESNIIDAAEDEKPQQQFSAIEDVMADPDKRDQLLAQAIRDAIAFKRRYKHLQELAQVWTALDDFLKTADV